MKVTSFKDVEIYVYSSIILPLKQLNLSEMEFDTPLQSNEGKEWRLRVAREPLGREFRRNYQRTQANRRRDWIVYLDTENQHYAIAKYKLKTHNVTVYEEPFKILDAKPLMGVICSQLSKNTPFTKITFEDVLLPARPRRHRTDRDFVEAENAIDYPDYDEDDEEWDDDL